MRIPRADRRAETTVANRVWWISGAVIPVVLRRLSNAEYTASVRDLTGVATLDPGKEGPEVGILVGGQMSPTQDPNDAAMSRQFTKLVGDVFGKRFKGK